MFSLRFMQIHFRLLVVALALLAALMYACPLAYAQEPSSAAVQAAIAEGSKSKGKHFGLYLEDSLSTLLPCSSKNTAVADTTGFAVEVFTPLSWVMTQASTAAAEYRTISVEDITVPNTLRVVVHPDKPCRMIRADLRGASSVKHVVIRDVQRSVAVQPLSTEPFDVTLGNALGADTSYTGLVATFDLSSLAEIRAMDKKQEFFITVVGSTGEEKDFKVKTKHFKHLR